MTKKQSRNGTIDLFRMLFCLIILLRHISKDIYGSGLRAGIFRHGALCVECFFIISGYYMCKSAYEFYLKNSEGACLQHKDYTKEYIHFIIRKVSPLLFYHIILNLFRLIYSAVLNSYSQEQFITLLPSFAFLPTIGFSSWLMAPEWYIGNMLFAMAIIYPLLIKWFNQISKYIAPLVGVCLFGYLMKEYHSVVGTDDMIRAYAGISLGVASFSLGEYIKRKTQKKPISIISIISFILFIGFILYTGSYMKNNTIQPVLVIIMWFVLSVTLSERGILSSTQLCNNSFFSWLGKISLPIYLVQTNTRILVKDLFFVADAKISFILELCLTIACGIVLYYIHYFVKWYMTIKCSNKIIKHLLVISICMFFVGLSIICAFMTREKYEMENPVLLEQKAFEVYYHETDDLEAEELTTIVFYGTSAKTMTTEDLGFNKQGRKFIGWRVFRPDTQQWRVQNADGKKSWKKWLNEDETYVLYKDGSSVKKTVEAGHTVHFYAQWDTK